MSDLVGNLRPHTKIVLAGGPRTGKSTTAVRAGERFGIPVRHGDELIQEYQQRYGKDAWSACSEKVSEWMEDETPWIIEGVVCPRAIRKWLRRNPDLNFPGMVVFFREPIQLQSPGQQTMAKGCLKVWREIVPELVAMGTPILTPTAAQVTGKEPL